MSTAANTLEWDLIGGSSANLFAKVTRDVAELADAGAVALMQDLEEQLARKRGELQELSKVAESVKELATGSEAPFPAQLEYSHTVRDASQTLVTRTETLTLADADEAVSASATFERRLEGWGRLQDQMVEELERHKERLIRMRGTLPGFVESSEVLLREVLATLR